MAVRTAIVVEGGAMRGIFSAGVLDALLALGLHDFDLAIGTSAGACNLASFVAGQYRRNLRCYVNIMARPELFDLRRALSGGHYMDLDWLWDAFAAEEPLDQEAIRDSRTELVSVATCANTGGPLYIAPTFPKIHDDLKAGCALPLLYRGPVTIQGQDVVDGGLVDPIPAEEAYRRGARRILVIRSRPASQVKNAGVGDGLVETLLRGQPAVARASRETAQNYARAVDFVRRPPEDAQVVVIAPERPLATKRTTQSRTSLLTDYHLGVSLGQVFAPRVRLLLRCAPMAPGA